MSENIFKKKLDKLVDDVINSHEYGEKYITDDDRKIVDSFIDHRKKAGFLTPKQRTVLFNIFVKTLVPKVKAQDANPSGN